MTAESDSFVHPHYRCNGICTAVNQHSVLRGLTQVEETLVSAVMPIMSIYRLLHGQYGYSGHVINLPQDVACFSTRLPRLPSELDVIVVRKESASQSHHDFVPDEVLSSELCSGLLCTTNTTVLTTYTLMSMPLISYHRTGISPSSLPSLSRVL